LCALRYIIFIVGLNAEIPKIRRVRREVMSNRKARFTGF
jgi:hypothetical protein